MSKVPRKKIIVLGGGLVGRHIATDLSSVHTVTCVDVSNLYDFFKNTNVDFKPIPVTPSIERDDGTFDITNSNVHALVREFDIVVNALPSFLGYRVLRDVVRAGKDVVDISFMEEDPHTLADLAEEYGSKIIVDMGVAPGLCGAFIGYEDSTSQAPIETVNIYVGGNPLDRKPPHYYKTPFSPKDVIQEYIRPVRMRERGRDVIAKPLSGPVNINCNGHSLVAFNTDGLRTLLTSFPHIPNMAEKTIRDFHHYSDMRVLQSLGFFDEKFIDTTSEILLPQWKYKDGEKDFTYMAVEVETAERMKTYRLYDEYKNGVPSMSRTTGYTCNAAVNLIAKDEIVSPGLYTPELVGANPRWLEYILVYLRNRDVIVEIV